jgi:type III pantothenate kinase
MNLLVDIGNTSVKWALAVAGRLAPSGRFVHRDADPAGQFDRAWGGLDAPARLVATNVAGDAFAARLSAWSAGNWRVEPEFLHAGREAAGVTNAYADPATLGADRWAALVAAWQPGGAAVCAVDCGTAITLDFVTADGRHRGGLILAGVAMMRNALGSQTANLPPVRDSRAPVWLATGTAEAISSGSLRGAAMAISGIVAGMATAVGEQPLLVVTGGDAPALLPLLGVTARHDADLVLKGIALLAGES